MLVQQHAPKLYRLATGIVGASDAHASSPADRPVTPAELVATMYHGLQLDPARWAARGEDPGSLPEGVAPVRELFA